jgi:hypothetical protein
VTELSRRNTLDSKYLLRTSRSDSMTRPASQLIFSSSKRKDSDDDEADEDDELRVEETKKKPGDVKRKTIVRLKQSIKKKAKPAKKEVAKSKKKTFAINHHESDDEMDELDSSTVGILDEVHPKKSNLSQSSVGVKGVGLLG